MAEFPPPEHSRGRRQEALHLGPERKYLGAGRRLPGKRQLVVRSPLCLGSHASVHTHSQKSAGSTVRNSAVRNLTGDYRWQKAFYFCRAEAAFTGFGIWAAAALRVHLNPFWTPVSS